jgi:hypothetical protein
MAENLDLKQQCDRHARDALHRGQPDIETNLEEVNMQTNSELKEVIRRLDSELRREKSHSNLLYREQGRAGPSSDHGAKLGIEDFNDRLDESLDGHSFPGKSHSHNLLTAGNSLVDTQAKEIEKLKSIIRSKEEDVKAMLEI